MTLDAIIILAKGLQADGSLPAIVRHEIDYAVQLATSTPVVAIIVSGLYWGLADNPGQVSEAEVMRQYAQTQLGERSVQVLVEDQSKDTIGNIVFSKQIVEAHGFKQLLVLATADHVNRVRFIMDKVFGADYQVSYHSHQHVFTLQQYLHTKHYEWLAQLYARWWFWTLSNNTTAGMIQHLQQHHFMYHPSWWTTVLKRWLRRPAHR